MVTTRRQSAANEKKSSVTRPALSKPSSSGEKAGPVRRNRAKQRRKGTSEKSDVGDKGGINEVESKSGEEEEHEEEGPPVKKVKDEPGPTDGRRIRDTFQEGKLWYNRYESPSFH